MRSIADISTQTWASMPASTTWRAPVASSRARNESIPQQEKVTFGRGSTPGPSVSSSSWSVWPSPFGYCSVRRIGKRNRRAEVARILMFRMTSSRWSASMAWKRRSWTSHTTKAVRSGVRVMRWGSWSWLIATSRDAGRRRRYRLTFRGICNRSRSSVCLGREPLFFSPYSSTPGGVRRAPSQAAVEPAVLDGLGDVLGGDVGGTGEVGDGPRDFEDAVVGPRGEAEPRDGQPQELRARLWQRAPAPRLSSGHPRVDTHIGPGEALVLPRPRGCDAGADGRRGFPRGGRSELGIGDGGDLEVKIDPIQERAREPREVLSALARRAAAGLDGWASAAAGIGSGDELGAGGEGGAAGGARNHQVPVLQRLAQRFEDAPGELGPLVQGRHSLIRCTGSRAFGLSSHEADLKLHPAAMFGTRV